MERAYLDWNFVNWVTVVLMASFGAILIGAIAAGLSGYLSPMKGGENG